MTKYNKMVKKVRRMRQNQDTINMEGYISLRNEILEAKNLLQDEKQSLLNGLDPIGKRLSTGYR